VKDKIPYIVIVILICVISYLYRNQPQPINQKIKEYEDYIDSVNTKIETQELIITKIQNQRDSTLIELNDKIVRDEETIKKKYDKKRNDILVLNDDESVRLLSKNLARK